MLIFGDLEREEGAADLAAEIGARLDACRGLEGLARHQALVAAFIRAGELAQGVCDALFEAQGTDEIGHIPDAASRLLLALATAVGASWESGLAHRRRLDAGPLLAPLAGAGRVRTRQAEGYAFYALYPEAYYVAARESGLGPDTTVIGIRSIGTGLAALVAAGLGAGELHTVRPVGHPFDRHVVLGDGLAARLGGATGSFALVDEGPGLSGSSFNCIVDWLRARGVSEERIHIFASHDGELGSAARPDHRQRWRGLARHVVRFETLVLAGTRPQHRLEHWLLPVIGPLRRPLEDVSGGAWRTLRQGTAALAPVDAAMERRKFVARTATGSWLVKFAGLGSSGERRLALGQRLADAGFGPRPLGVRHGFLVAPLVEDRATGDEAVPLPLLADYLAFRATLPAERAGAGLEQLFAMAAHNIGELWGEAAAAEIRAGLGDAGRFTPLPCCTDNRMHGWEWLKGPDGWLKLDALDHHAAHDLVGCQDIAWDVAGAAVEGGLAAGQRDRLAAGVAERSGRPVPRDFVAALELGYLGFQLGLWSMARERAPVAERAAIDATLARYAAHPALRAARIASGTARP